MRKVTVATLLTLLLTVVGSPSLQAGTITGVSAGAGLQGGGTNGNVQLDVVYGGNGISNNVCHGDHTHAGDRWDIYDQPTTGLTLVTHCTPNDSTCNGTVLDAESLATGGAGVGLVGRSYATLGYGVLGYNWATSGKATGLSGSAPKSPDGVGVFGTAGGTTSGSPLGVLGGVVAPLGIGVQGLNSASSGAGYGVSGKSSSPAGFGVSGHNLATTGNAIGVQGESFSSAGYGGFFRNQAGGTGLRVRVDHATSTTKFISSTNGAYLSAGGTWTNASDVNLKDNFSPIDNGGILQKLRDMRIEEWSYKTEGTSVRHVGPTAQDFRAAFALGTDDRTITTVDEAGIALAAIQELDRRTTEIAQLKAQLARLEAAVLALQSVGKN